MYQIAICDDERVVGEKIFKIVKDFFHEQCESCRISTFTKGKALLRNLEENYYDIIVLDIELNDINGMEVARGIREKYQEPIILFVTAHDQYAISGYELEIFRYIPKQKVNLMLKNALKAAIEKIDKKEKVIFIETCGTLRRVYLREILFIYRDGKNSVYVLESEEIKVRRTLKETFMGLNQNQFLFIDRGFIVNAAYIKAVEGSDLILKNGKKLAISYSRIKATRDFISEYWRRQRIC